MLCLSERALAESRNHVAELSEPLEYFAELVHLHSLTGFVNLFGGTFEQQISGFPIRFSRQSTLALAKLRLPSTLVPLTFVSRRCTEVMVYFVESNA